MSLFGKEAAAGRVIVALLAAAALGSCAANMTLSIDPDGSGSLAVDARIPDAAAVRLESFRSAGSDPSQPPAPFFDAQAIRAETSARGMRAVSVQTPSPNRFKGSFSIRSLADALKNPEISKAGLLRLETAGGTSTLSFTLTRENAESLPSLFPGIDPYLLESLSPPALDPYPVTSDEYREMLKALLGDAAMKEMNEARVVIAIQTPGPITASEGGTVSGRSFTAVLSLIDMLVLEKPLGFSVSWR